MQITLNQPVAFYDCIQSCFESASASWICADACLHEADHDQLGDCIEACLLSAEACAATARILIRHQEENLMAELRHCINALAKTRAVCERRANDREHCQISARCAENCLVACLEIIAGTEEEVQFRTLSSNEINYRSNFSEDFGRPAF